MKKKRHKTKNDMKKKAQSLLTLYAGSMTSGKLAVVSRTSSDMHASPIVEKYYSPSRVPLKSLNPNHE
jgi:hypothetical protein